MLNHENQLLKFQNFQQLHKESYAFVLPNAWDVISAKIFEKNGFPAVATTSAGIAMSLGYTDGEKIPFEQMLGAVKRIINSVNIPVSVDLESGYGRSINEVVDNARQIILAGGIGINLEDGTGDLDSPILDVSLQVERISEIRLLSKSLKVPLFINARTDLYWLNIGDLDLRLQEAISRGKAYQKAGADCIFIPGLYDIESIKKVRQELSCPINLLSGPNLPSINTLAQVGIERISTGSAPFRATATLLQRITEDILYDNNFQRLLNDNMSYNAITELIGPPK
ncbi:isocitrate lyase/PEP mutase family protein [Priestia megaterium]|uniref:isocitrate lyase/PEP mutase family protein n=1 Tax=Priestia megaterium TaxID=1404 RepID=UPI00211D6884|nr:isocitrate lyase/phosphoenolpyruvate mutase family protein [Priestia megaterium]